MGALRREKEVRAMTNRKGFVLLTILLIGLFCAATVSAGAIVEQRAVLAGKVVTTVSVGASVREGDELVRVETLAGSATAARATTSGVVRAVLVAPGQEIRSGDIVVRLEAQ